MTEYEAIAKKKLPKMVYDYYAHGAKNLSSFHEIFIPTMLRFHPQILIDVSKISMPIMISTIAMQKMAHPEAMELKRIILSLL
ncbi:hypothetical protein GOBAR_AA13990 [Gossypium barbadense]|uniref:FMN-dependent dehydrogenase domain-containing protein n=1 Tax=Gossypium barbadense TaxID=3634 RepID=A0A2P5XTH6_GOSBA|nr:hypothetical protein GOBAR_AA13990 [Gossypium barbadense]